MSEYLELMEDAFASLEALLDVTHHGKGVTLRTAYLQLEEDIEAHKRVEVPRSPAPPAREQWSRLPSAERERQVMAVLSERRMTISELAGHLRDQESELDVYRSCVANVVNRLYKARELDREGEQFRNRTRYRYFRRTALEGAIYDLDSAFHRDGG